MQKSIEPTMSVSLTVKDADTALSFYTEALEAKELFRLSPPDGGIAHAEIMIGNSRIYKSEESEEWHAFAMPDNATASCLFALSTDDCDRSYLRAIEASALSLSQPQDHFWGTRSAVI